MRVLIVSPMFRFDGKNISAFIRNKIKHEHILSPNINLGSLYLASVAMKHGHEVSVKICCKSDFKEIFNEYNPDILLISAMDTQAATAIYIAKAAKSIKKSVKIIMGGYFPTACYEELLKELPWLDFAVIGEGEGTLDNILSYYEGKIKSKGRIKGVAFVRKGKIVFTGHRELTNIDKIPFPARFLMPKNSSGFLITSRGCLYNCRFCSIKNFYRRVYRKRSISSVVKEINHIKKILKGNPISKILIYDDCFIIKNTFYEFKARLDKRGLEKISFSCMMRLDQVIMPGVLEQLEHLNFSRVGIGLQNISEEVLNYFRTGINKSHIRKFISLLKRNRKIKIEIFYIINSGLPNETSESIRKNISDFLSLIERIKNLQVKPMIFSPFSGSEVGGKSPFREFMYSENEGYVSNGNVSDTELNEIRCDFTNELIRRGQYIVRASNIFNQINDIFFFLTSSLRAKTKIHMVFDSAGWFFISLAKMELPLSYIKKRIEQKYFL